MTRDTQYPPMFGAAGEPFLEEREGLLLVGLVIRSGDVIDAITPLYRPLTEAGELAAGLLRGAQTGGDGGDEHIVLMEGCAVSSLQYKAVTYFGHAGIMGLQLGFRRFSEGGFSGDERWSEGFAVPPRHQAIGGAILVSTSGEGFALIERC